jgi:hypothetical protein
VVDSLEIGRKYEEVWEKQHLDDAGKVWTTNSSTKAIRKAQTQNKYPAVISEVPVSPAPVPKRRAGVFEEARIQVAKDMKKKHVTFTADTVNWPVRHQTTFSRDPENKPYHNPPNGRHPAPLGVEWIDTSRVTDRIADLLNLKVYTTRVQAEFDAFLKDQTLRPLSRYNGIEGNRSGIASISENVDRFLNETETTRDEMYEWIDRADALAILVNEDVVKDMCFMRSNDVEDEEDYGEEEVDQTRWTCRAQCVVVEKAEVISAARLAAHFSMTEEQKAERRALEYRIGDEWVAPGIEGQNAKDVFSPGEGPSGKRRK